MNTTHGKLSVAQLMEEAGQHSPNKEAIYDGVRRLTFKDLLNESDEIAAGLSHLGIEKGDRIAVTLPTWYEFITIVFAISKIGAITVPFNTRYREEEAQHIIEDSGAKAVFFTSTFDKVDHLSQLQAIKKRVSQLEHIISVRSEHEGMLSYHKLTTLGRHAPLQKIKVNPVDDVFAIIYTSGTTGKPKGAMITHHNIISIGRNGSSATGARKNDTTLHVSPYFHIMGMGSIIRMMIYKTKAVLQEQYKAEEVLKLIEQEKITVRGGVPTTFILEMNHPSFEKYDLSSLRLIVMAGAPCPVDVIRKVKSKMGCPVIVSYGMTETSAALTYTRLEDEEYIQAETVGRAIPGVELTVVNERKNKVPVGAVGELACRSVGLMKGYYNLPDKTREVIDENGWFYTGDLVTMDEEGYIRIVGRKKDVIIRGGFNIYPTEVENVLYKHPAVMEVSIVGLPDTVLGEVTCAAVVWKSNTNINMEKFNQFIRDQVSDYKRPDHIIVLDKLPRTHSGKVKKNELREWIMNEKKVSLR